MRLRRAYAGLAASLLAIALAVALPGPSHAGGFSNCSTADIYPESAVNLVILPYSLGAPNDRLQFDHGNSPVLDREATARLSTLLQLDMLYALRYPGGLAAVHLTPDGATCAIGDVVPRVSDQMLPGHGAVFLWGNVLEIEGELFVRSFATFLRKDRSSQLELRVRVLGQPVSFLARLPQNVFDFAPRRLTERDLRQILEAEQTARVIYASPAGTQPIGEIPTASKDGFAYTVTAVDPETGQMAIVPRKASGLNPGWLAARSEWPLREKMPELDVVDALVGYLVAQILVDDVWLDNLYLPPNEALGLTVDQLLGQLRSFLAARRAEDPGGSKENAEGPDFDTGFELAQAMDLGGLTNLWAYAQTARNEVIRADAEDYFRAAAHLAPYLAETHNLEAIALAMRPDLSATAGQAAIASWRTALALDPSNRLVAENLASFYRALLASNRAEELVGASREDLETRLELLR